MKKTIRRILQIPKGEVTKYLAYALSNDCPEIQEIQGLKEPRIYIDEQDETDDEGLITSSNLIFERMNEAEQDVIFASDNPAVKRFLFLAQMTPSFQRSDELLRRMLLHLESINVLKAGRTDELLQ